MMMNFTNDNLDCLWRFGSSLLAFGLKTVLLLRKRAEAKELTCPIGAMKQTPETTNNTTPSAPIAGAAMAGKAVSKCIAAGYAAPKIPDLTMLIIFMIFRLL